MAALRRAARERGGPLPSIDVADALLDERLAHRCRTDENPAIGGQRRPVPCIVKFAVWHCCYRKAPIMGALKFVGLAILTAVAPIAVLIGSSPARADPPAGGHGGLISTFREYNAGEKCTCLGLLTREPDWNGRAGHVIQCDGSEGDPNGWHWYSAEEFPAGGNIGVRPDGTSCEEP